MVLGLHVWMALAAVLIVPLSSAAVFVYGVPTLRRPFLPEFGRVGRFRAGAADLPGARRADGGEISISSEGGSGTRV